MRNQILSLFAICCLLATPVSEAVGGRHAKALLPLGEVPPAGDMLLKTIITVDGTPHEFVDSLFPFLIRMRHKTNAQAIRDRTIATMFSRAIGFSERELMYEVPFGDDLLPIRTGLRRYGLRSDGGTTKRARRFLGWLELGRGPDGRLFRYEVPYDPSPIPFGEIVSDNGIYKPGLLTWVTKTDRTVDDIEMVNLFDDFVDGVPLKVDMGFGADNLHMNVRLAPEPSSMMLAIAGAAMAAAYAYRRHRFARQTGSDIR